MGHIKGFTTKPETIVCSAFHKNGFRFSLHTTKLPGKPDSTLPKHKAVIFVRGCFRHRHKRREFAYMPRSRIDFYTIKIWKKGVAGK
jgi:DNA mismatch endonuclease, patch repair protein